MANKVYANGQEIACKAGSGKTICAMPDVCFTPPENPATPPGVPVPYPNSGFDSDTTEGSKTVKISGEEIMLKNKSYFKKSTGDEAGAAAKKGMITSTNTGKVYFIKWSMDVKFEGENVNRNLDMTTNNHASPNGNEAVPWVFQADFATFSNQEGPCKKEADAMAKGGCESPNDTSEKCCAVPERQCVLIPKKKDKTGGCCPGKKTGHHVLPKQEFCVIGSAGRSLPENPNYNHLDAPTICVEAPFHRSADASGNIQDHGRIGSQYTRLRRQWRTSNPEAELTYKKVSELGAQSVADTVQPCTKECIQAQADNYHSSRVAKVHESNQLVYENRIPNANTPAQG